MISVHILINGREIFRKGARRVSGQPGEMCTYEILGEEEQFIHHHYDDGATVLAEKILKHENKYKKRRK